MGEVAGSRAWAGGPLSTETMTVGQIVAWLKRRADWLGEEYAACERMAKALRPFAESLEPESSVPVRQATMPAAREQAQPPTQPVAAPSRQAQEPIPQPQAVPDEDQRVVYGEVCTWWGSVREAGRTGDGIPCCPVCRGSLYEVDNEAEFMRAVQAYEHKGHPGYAQAAVFGRGKCFQTAEALIAASAAVVKGGGR